MGEPTLSYRYVFFLINKQTDNLIDSQNVEQIKKKAQDTGHGVTVYPQITVKNGTEQEFYFTFDGHGSTRALLDFAGAIIQLYAFDAYGNALGFDPNQALTEFLYSGEQFDSKIGQQYLRQRYYDPVTGRFNRIDPFFGNLDDPQSLHKYLYTHVDPVNGIDPSGMSVVVSISVGNIGGQLAQGIKLVAVQVARATVQASIYVMEASQSLLLTVMRSAAAMGSEILTVIAKVVAQVLVVTRNALIVITRDIALSGYTISKIPFYFVPELITPNIYTNTVGSLAKNPQWYLLNYGYPGLSRINRPAAIGDAVYRGMISSRIAPTGMSLDEFPYACTRQGGKGSDVWAVPWRENALQGGYLGAFVRWTLKTMPDHPFLVLPIAK
jgi:RHS repeat-associated protein